MGREEKTESTFSLKKMYSLSIKNTSSRGPASATHRKPCPCQPVLPPRPTRLNPRTSGLRRHIHEQPVPSPARRFPDDRSPGGTKWGLFFQAGLWWPLVTATGSEAAFIQSKTPSREPFILSAWNSQRSVLRGNRNKVSALGSKLFMEFPQKNIQ